MRSVERNRNSVIKGRCERDLDFEMLEARRMLAANIDGDGNLTIEGTEGFDQISVIQFGSDTTVVIATNGVAQGNGTVLASVPSLGLDVVLFGAVNDLTINSGGETDIVMVGYSFFSGIKPVSISGQLSIDVGEGASNAAIVVGTAAQGGLQVFGGGGADHALAAYSEISGGMLIDTGEGDDLIQLGVAGAPVVGAGDVEVDAGGGNDVLSIANSPLPSHPSAFEVDNLTIRMGAGDDVVNIVGEVQATGTVSINGGAGTQDALNIAIPISASQTDIDEFELP